MSIYIELKKVADFAHTCMENRDEPEFTMFSEIYGALCEILHSHQEAEPLAVLAERHNCWIDTHQNRNLSKRIILLFYQQTTNGPIQEPVEFRGKTYAECESKAREYIMSLEDKK